jgi:hypothetical protein
MITISITIPSIPAEWIVALTFMVAPLLLLSAVRFASGTASVIRQLTK